MKPRGGLDKLLEQEYKEKLFFLFGRDRDRYITILVKKTRVNVIMTISWLKGVFLGYVSGTMFGIRKKNL